MFNRIAPSEGKLKFRGILRATAAATAVAAVALAAPASAGAARAETAMPGAGARPASATVPAATVPAAIVPAAIVPVRHWHPRTVNLHAAFERVLGHVRPGRRMGIVPPVGKKMVASTTHRRGEPDTGQSGCTEPNCDLAWNSGSVEHAPKLYVLFWGPTWETDAGEQTSASYLLNLYSGLGQPGDNWSRVTSQYTDGSGRPAFRGGGGRRHRLQHP
jgi:hypothetical protein